MGLLEGFIDYGREPECDHEWSEWNENHYPVGGHMPGMHSILFDDNDRMYVGREVHEWRECEKCDETQTVHKSTEKHYIERESIEEL